MCTVAGCDRLTRARGLCSTHYKHWYKGHPLEVEHWPPIPDGLLDACTARLDAVHDGPGAEADASVKLRALIDNLP